MKFLEDDDSCKNKMWRMSDINNNFSKIFVVIVRIVVFNFIFAFIFSIFFVFFFFCIFIFAFVVVVIVVFVATIFFDFFTSFVFDCKFEMFYVTIVDVMIKTFTFTTSFDFLSDCHDVIFRDIFLKKFVEIDDQINDQKSKIVIVDDNNFKRICTLNFVNMNDIRKNEFELVDTIVIEKLVLRNSTINERTSAFWKICHIIVNESILIHLWIEWINDKFVDDVSKLNVIIINNKTFKNFDNFEFNVNEHKNIKTFEFVNFDNFFQIIFAIMRFLISW